MRADFYSHYTLLGPRLAFTANLKEGEEPRTFVVQKEDDV